MTQIQGKTDFWRAVIADSDGFTFTDEAVRAWCADPEKAEFYREGSPDTLMIVTGEALPGPQSEDPEETIFRNPNPLPLSDVLFQADISNDEPDAILRQWERAVAVAEAMNAAEVKA